MYSSLLNWSLITSQLNHFRKNFLFEGNKFFLHFQKVKEKILTNSPLSIEDCNKSRWLRVEIGDGAPFIRLSNEDPVVVVVVGVVVDVVREAIGVNSPFLLSSMRRCFIIDMSLSFSFVNWNSNWFTIWSWTLVWAVVLSSSGWTEARCRPKSETEASQPSFEKEIACTIAK